MNRKIILIPSGDAPNVANAALTAVAHGGNPHRPWRLPLGEDRAASPKSKIRNLKLLV
ncbi:MAG: hypothetical protein V7L22_22310 [Nostoc sp.]|uniref:hypothetical protein n=1 Tax=Nostoc sp. TaxID=1180 RepID=UPI002FF74E2E